MSEPAISEPRTLTIDIWSDVMCPWCLVGWGQLQKGLELLQGEIRAEIRWHAFELNPDMPEHGEDRTEHLARKYGRTIEQSKGMQGQMREAAESAGVSLDFEGEGEPPAAMMWNTFAAHKLLTWVGESYGPAKQTEMKLSLFKAHFNDRRAIGNRDVLLQIAEENGIARPAAAEAMGREEYDHKVRAEERAAWEMNISGVPAMVVDGKFLIPGAQAPEVYANALRRVAEKTAR